MAVVITHKKEVGWWKMCLCHTIEEALYNVVIIADMGWLSCCNIHLIVFFVNKNCDDVAKLSFDVYRYTIVSLKQRSGIR